MPVVAIQRARHDRSDAEIAAIVRKTIELAGGIPEKVRRARSILVKPNYVGANSRPSDDAIKRYQGRFLGCTEPIVTHTTVAMIREANPSAEIIVSEGVDNREPRVPEDCFRAMGADRLADEFGARLLNANTGTLGLYDVPGGGLLHRAIHLRREVAEADAVVSVAKLKMHGTAGVTLSLKNMFGLLPRTRYGSTYRNFMHANHYRLMRVIVDIATLRRPDLAVIDGTIASDHGIDHTPIEAGLMLAGHDPLATDAVGTALLGFSPRTQFPEMPFLVSESHLLLAEQVGIGTLDLDRIEVRGVPIAEARPRHTFTIQTERNVTTEESRRYIDAARSQARVFAARREELLGAHRGRYIFLREGEVVWSVPTLAEAADRAIKHPPPDGYGLTIQVVPEAEEIERVAAYA